MNTNNSLLSLLPEHKKNIFFGVIGLTVVDGIMLLVPIIIGDIVTKLSEPNSSEILTSSINKATAYLLLCGLGIERCQLGYLHACVYDGVYLSTVFVVFRRKK